MHPSQVAPSVHPHRLLAITQQLQDPATRYRVAIHASLLFHCGITTTVVPWPGDDAGRSALLDSVPDYDSVLIQRRLLLLRHLRLLRKRAKRLVYDFDDAIIYRDSFDGHPWLLPDRWVRFRAILRCCDHVTAGNPYLADLARSIGGNTPISVVPTVIDTDRYNQSSHTRNGSKELVIGWIGQRTTLPYLENLHGALRLVSQSVAGRLVTLSDRHPAMRGVRTEAIAWSSDNEVNALSRFDIGVAPLADDRWTRGKCGLRLLQYLAAGVPAVASPVGTQREIIAEGGCLKATLLPEWVDAIVRLSRDLVLRQELVETGRKIIRKRYAPEVWTDHLCTAWCNIVKKEL